METGEVLVEGVAIAVEGVAGKALAKASVHCNTGVILCAYGLPN